MNSSSFASLVPSPLASPILSPAGGSYNTSLIIKPARGLHGHPLNSCNPATSGHRSSESGVPSPSVSVSSSSKVNTN